MIDGGKVIRDIAFDQVAGASCDVQQGRRFATGSGPGHECGRDRHRSWEKTTGAVGASTSDKAENQRCAPPMAKCKGCGVCR